MDGKWRVGLLRADTRERMWLLNAERRAKEMAFGEAYNEKCAANDSLLVDAHDLDIRSVRTEWTRYERRVLAIITVHYRSAGRVRTYRWRSPVLR